MRFSEIVKEAREWLQRDGRLRYRSRCAFSFCASSPFALQLRQLDINRLGPFARGYHDVTSVSAAHKVKRGQSWGHGLDAGNQTIVILVFFFFEHPDLVRNVAAMGGNRLDLAHPHGRGARAQRHRCTYKYQTNCTQCLTPIGLTQTDDTQLFGQVSPQTINLVERFSRQIKPSVWIAPLERATPLLSNILAWGIGELHELQRTPLAQTPCIPICKQAVFTP